VCSHATFVKSNRHVIAAMGSDAGASDFWDQDRFDWKEADENTRANTLPAIKSNQHVIADFDSGHLKLITDIGERSSPTLDGLQQATTDAGSASVTLSPRARQREHAYEYLAEFTIQLNMTRAHDLGMPLGIKLRYDTDYEPARVSRIQKHGLVEEWNTGNPDKNLLVGDEIVQVNTIKWHHNTPTFVQRIIGQFKAGRKELEGTSEILSLYVQRPGPKASNKRYPSQRLDAHAKAFPVEFDIEIPFGLVPSERMGGSMYSLLGFELNYGVDWNPVSIAKIEDDGILASYITLHPDRIILEGDQIMKVNNIAWHHSARAFELRLRQQFDAFLKGDGTNKTLGLAIRRPAAVHEAWLAAHPHYADRYADEVADTPADDDEPVMIGEYEDDEQDEGEAKPGQDEVQSNAKEEAEAVPADTAAVALAPKVAAEAEAMARAEAGEDQNDREDVVWNKLIDLEHLKHLMRLMAEVASARKRMQEQLDHMTKKQLEDSISMLPQTPEVADVREALVLQLQKHLDEIRRF